MSAARFTLTGGKKMKRVLERLGNAAPKVLASCFVVEAETIMAKAKLITPVEFGDLRGSGHVEPPKISGKRVSVKMGFGGAAAPYAIFVHEIPPSQARHKPPTQWKYLEQPFKEAKAGMMRRLERCVQRQLLRPSMGTA